LAQLGFPARGEIYWVNLDPTIGSEIPKTRPAVVVSNDVGNEYSSRVIVAPITSGGVERIYPFEALIPAGEGGVDRTSKALLNQVRTVDKRRLGRRIGRLSAERMLDIDRAIKISFAV
jgi:mRNA interferase MazF